VFFNITAYGNSLDVGAISSTLVQNFINAKPMKNSKSILTRRWLIGVFGLYATHALAQLPAEQVKQELFDLEQSLNVEVMRHDTGALKQILADEYQLTVLRLAAGIRRSQWLANVPKGSADSVIITDVSVSNWGEVAVFRSLQHFYNAVIVDKPSTFDAWITDLWIKRDKRWQLVTRLSERVPKK
jgi:hypothetical protein